MHNAVELYSKFEMAQLPYPQVRISHCGQCLWAIFRR